MALVIIDPGLHMIAGHHFELDTALLAAASSLGVSGHIFCHRTNNPHLNDHPEITPFFDVLGRTTTEDPMLTDLDRFLLENEGVYRDLNRLAEVVDMEESILFYATARLHSLTGLGRWAREWRVPPRHLFVLLPEYFIFALEGGVGTLDQLFYRYGFAQFPSVDPSRITFLTLSKRQVAEYGRISGRRIIQAPYPVGEVSGALSAKPSIFEPPSRLRVVVCGTSRNSKGFDLLPAVIRRVMDARSDVEFVVQYCPTEEVSAEAAALAGSGATVIEGYLDRDSYHGLIRSADIVFLPYMGRAIASRPRQSSRRRGGSGVPPSSRQRRRCRMTSRLIPASASLPLRILRPSHPRSKLCSTGTRSSLAPPRRHRFPIGTNMGPFAWRRCCSAVTDAAGSPAHS